MFRLLSVVCLVSVCAGQGKPEEYPDGYYPFEESFNQLPPKVRKPPYLQTDTPCPGVDLEGEQYGPQDLETLCGDLNSGTLPLNPLGHSIFGESYPFDLIKNKTLEFFSNTLPVLRDDATLPKVAKFNHPPPNKRFAQFRPRTPARAKRSTEVGAEEGRAAGLSEEQARQARAFCESNFGIFCSIMNMFRGDSSPSHPLETRNDQEPQGNALPGAGLPPTPCPSSSEYVTPVFARNYQGVWRYVVQIPLEGYFTQTLEKVTCLNGRCSYMEGSCLASPRWVSLLVAEMFYPDSYFPTTPPPKPQKRAPPVQEFERYQQYLYDRAGVAPTTAAPAPYCDGHDEIGCFQDPFAPPRNMGL